MLRDIIPDFCSVEKKGAAIDHLAGLSTRRPPPQPPPRGQSGRVGIIFSRPPRLAAAMIDLRIKFLNINERVVGRCKIGRVLKTSCLDGNVARQETKLRCALLLQFPLLFSFRFFALHLIVVSPLQWLGYLRKRFASCIVFWGVVLRICF